MRAPDPARPQAADALADRALGAYLGLALGDALGATVEFMTPREIAAAHGVHRRIVGAGWLKLAPGQVTDDTTMSLALGRATAALWLGVVPLLGLPFPDAWHGVIANSQGMQLQNPYFVAYLRTLPRPSTSHGTSSASSASTPALP